MNYKHTHTHLETILIYRSHQLSLVKHRNTFIKGNQKKIAFFIKGRMKRQQNKHHSITFPHHERMNVCRPYTYTHLLVLNGYCVLKNTKQHRAGYIDMFVCTPSVDRVHTFLCRKIFFIKYLTESQSLSAIRDIKSSPFLLCVLRFFLRKKGGLFKKKLKS